MIFCKIHATKFIKLLNVTSKEKLLKKNFYLQRTKKKKKLEKKQLHIFSNLKHLKNLLDQSIESCPSLLRYVLAKSI